MRQTFRRAGFIIFFGWRPVATREPGVEPARVTCPNCQREADFVSLLRRTWFTLFFIPVLPLDSRQNAERVCKCTACRTTFDRPLEQFARRLWSEGQTDWSHSIELYNKLRDNPSDGATMVQLLQIYEAMNEPHEAEVAARQFPRAVAAEPRCAAVLGRMGVAQGH